MFYSEKLQSPISSYNVKRLYGVNPDNDPARAALIGIYPMTEVSEGYNVSHYKKEGDRYIAKSKVVSRLEEQMVKILRDNDVSLEALITALGLDQDP